MNKAPLVVVSTSQDVGFGSRVAQAAGVELGSTVFKKFKDGEIWTKYKDNLRGSDVYIVGSTNPPADNLMEMLIMIDAAVKASTGRVTAVIPYFGFGRQDRKDQPRVSITAKLVAKLLETAAGRTPFRVITMELHAPQIQGFFDCPIDHLYASKTLIEIIRQENISDLVVVSPDVGGSKRARVYAKNLDETGHIGIAVIDKRRPTQNLSEVINIIGEVKGKNIMIVDDIIDTGGSLIGAVDALTERGCANIYVCATHGLFSDNALNRLSQSRIEKIFVTNTLPVGTTLPIFHQVDVSPIFGEAIKKAHLNESVSDLFLENKG